jgi:RNA polymerase sigma-70 factor (ECF subfamily)
VDEVERRTLLDAWFRAYSDRVFAYLLHRADRDTAADVLQEVFVIAFRRAEDVPDEPVGWLFGTARRVLANKRRSSQREADLLSRLAEAVASTANDANSSAEDLRDGDAELRRAFADTLVGLPEADREVLTLAAWYDLTPAEAAQALDLSSNAYAVRLHRARKRLADRLLKAGYHSESPAGRLAEALRD